MPVVSGFRLGAGDLRPFDKFSVAPGDIEGRLAAVSRGWRGRPQVERREPRAGDYSPAERDPVPMTRAWRAG